MRVGVYEVEGEIGHGGSGVVFRARAPDGSPVAIKLLQRVDAAALGRFDREARLLGTLGEEQGFVPLIDRGATPQAWIAMPFVPGGTLRARLAQGPLDVDDARELIAAIARALGEAHARGVVHRDLKPENVLFAADGRPLVADLGLAKHFAADGQSVSLSVSQTFRGTAGYAAPEQIEDAKNVGPAADVFSLGAVLYECLAGEPPFAGATIVEVVGRIAEGAYAPIRSVRAEVPRPLAAVLDRALDVRAARRFADGHQLARALDESSRAHARRVPRALVLVAVVAAGGATAGILAMSSRRAPPERMVPSAPPGPAPRPVPGSVPPEVAANPAPATRGPYAYLANEAAHPGGREFLRGLTFARDRKAREAIAAFSRAIELEPGLGVAWAARAHVKLDWEDDAGARADLDRARALDPGEPLVLAVEGAWHGARNDLETAISFLESAVAKRPDDVVTGVLLGNALARKGDLSAALAAIDRALEADPTFAEAHVERSVVLVAMNDVEGAFAAANRAIELAPMNPRGYAKRGALHGMRGEIARALPDLVRATELDPASAEAWANLGSAYSESNEPDRALEALDRAVQLDPVYLKARLNRAIVRMNRREPAPAEQDFSLVIERDATIAQAWLGRGCVRAQLRRWDEARGDLERAVSLDPSSPVAEQARAALTELPRR